MERGQWRDAGFRRREWGFDRLEYDGKHFDKGWRAGSGDVDVGSPVKWLHPRLAVLGGELCNEQECLKKWRLRHEWDACAHPLTIFPIIVAEELDERSLLSCK